MRTQRQTKTPERKLPGAFAMALVYARVRPPVKGGSAFLAQAVILHKAHRASIVQPAQIWAVLARRMRGCEPRNGAGVARCRVAVVCILHGRAGDFARPTDQLFENFNVRRGQDPALQSGGNGQPTGNPARGKPLPGGIYASPTNKGAAYASQKCCRRANGHGRHVCLPYKHPVPRIRTPNVTLGRTGSAPFCTPLPKMQGDARAKIVRFAHCQPPRRRV